MTTKTKGVASADGPLDNTSQTTDESNHTASRQKRKHFFMTVNIGESLADAQGMNTECVGAYFLLLLAYGRRRGPIQADDKSLTALTGIPLSRFKLLKPKILAPFDRDGDFYRLTWLDNEIESALRHSEKMRKAANVRWHGGTRNV